MKATITRPDGTKIECDGTAEEIERLAGSRVQQQAPFHIATPFFPNWLPNQTGVSGLSVQPQHASHCAKMKTYIGDGSPMCTCGIGDIISSLPPATTIGFVGTTTNQNQN